MLMLVMVEFENATAELIRNELTHGFAINLNFPQSPGGIPQLNFELVSTVLVVSLILNLAKCGSAGACQNSLKLLIAGKQQARLN
jgi:hypothetical protein